MNCRIKNIVKVIFTVVKQLQRKQYPLLSSCCAVCVGKTQRPLTANAKLPKTTGKMGTGANQVTKSGLQRTKSTTIAPLVIPTAPVYSEGESHFIAVHDV